MSASPQPPRPPIPPRPPHTGSHWLAIALLGLALIIVVSVMTVWIGLRFLSRGVHVDVQEHGPGAKQVSINTPVGSLEVNQEVDESRLGLPIYPGAQRLKNQDSANVRLRFGEEAGLHVVAAKFETPDSLDKVKGFYRERLGSDVTNFLEKNNEGKTLFEIKRRGTEKIVALRDVGGRTQIELVSVAHGVRETN